MAEAKKPPTLIHSSFAKATSAGEMMKFGNIDDISTANESLASKSKKNHIIHVRNADAPSLKLVRK